MLIKTNTTKKSYAKRVSVFGISNFVRGSGRENDGEKHEEAVTEREKGEKAKGGGSGGDGQTRFDGFPMIDIFGGVETCCLP